MLFDGLGSSLEALPGGFVKIVGCLENLSEAGSRGCKGSLCLMGI